MLIDDDDDDDDDVAEVLSSQHAGTGATWRINTKILLTCRGRRHVVSPRAQLVLTLLTFQSVSGCQSWF